MLVSNIKPNAGLWTSKNQTVMVHRSIVHRPTSFSPIYKSSSSVTSVNDGSSPVSTCDVSPSICTDDLIPCVSSVHRVSTCRILWSVQSVTEYPSVDLRVAEITSCVQRASRVAKPLLRFRKLLQGLRWILYFGGN